MKRKLIFLSFLFLMIFLQTACCDIEYQGVSEAPLSEMDHVELYLAKNRIPTANYRVLGTAYATSGVNYTATEVENKLRNFAREKGANGVLIISVDRIVAGEARVDQLKNNNDMSWKTKEHSFTDFQFFKEDALAKKKDDSPEREVYKIRIKAELINVPTVK